MWTERHHYALEDYELPEVNRVDLAGTVLALHAWGADDPRKFGWYERPPEESLAGAERLLAMLGATRIKIAPVPVFNPVPNGTSPSLNSLSWDSHLFIDDANR
jgi:hypothetical protein